MMKYIIKNDYKDKKIYVFNNKKSKEYHLINVDEKVDIKTDFESENIVDNKKKYKYNNGFFFIYKIVKYKEDNKTPNFFFKGYKFEVQEIENLEKYYFTKKRNRKLLNELLQLLGYFYIKFHVYKIKRILNEKK